MTAILGISAFYHDSAAAWSSTGKSSRPLRRSGSPARSTTPRFPPHAVEYCLHEAGLTPDRLDYVAFYDKPLAQVRAAARDLPVVRPGGFRSFSTAMPVWLKKKLFMRRAIRKALRRGLRAPLLFLDHHESHAASAFFPSPFDEAAILTLDGVGEWSTAAYGTGAGNRIRR